MSKVIQDAAESNFTMDYVCELVVDCPHSTPKWTDSGITVLRSNNIRNGRIDFAKTSYTDEDNYKQRVKRAVPKSGDLIITREAPMGEVCMIPDGLKCCLGQRMVLLRPDSERVDGRYLLYAIQSPSIQNQIAWNEGTGSTVSNLRIPMLKELKVPWFPLPEQRAIAHILGLLDDKIELNRRMNETLEAMAQALFKSWFVDFDPVHAKAQGRDTGLPKDIADLFPDSFQESELGQIPTGWAVKPLSELVDLIGGGTPKTSIKEYWDGDIPWFSVVDAPVDSDVFVLGTDKHVSQKGVDNSSTKILPYGTTIISARGTVGKCALVGRPMAMNQSCYGVNGSDGRGALYTYYLIRNQVGDLQRSGHGSVFNTITRATFKSLLTVDSGPEITCAFDSIVESYLDRVLENNREKQCLTSLRDTLLPKLISGELRVTDAEKAVEVKV